MDSQDTTQPNPDAVWAMDLASEADPAAVAEIHATVVGLVCAQPNIEASEVLRHLDALEGDVFTSDSGDALQAQASAMAPVIAALKKRLGSMTLSFQPLLPTDDQPLAQRTQCLAHWCSGFLAGFGAGQGSLDSQDAQEAASMLGEVARATSDPEADTEGEENAYAELVEFVRVAVLLLREENLARS